MAIDLDFTSKFIAKFEGFVDHVYRDAVGVETIGYGETRRDIIERYRSSGISETDAFALLRQRVQQFADAVESSIANRGALTADRHAAFTSLAYNIGVGGFADSTACRRFNEGDLAGACEAIGWWDKAGGAVLPGLARRRSEEMALFRGDGGGLPAAGSPSIQGGTTRFKLIREGDRGDHVRQAQQCLAGCGITILVDGYYGPISVTIVQGFQRDHGLDADGVIGPATWDTILGAAPAATSPGAGRGAPPRPGRLLRQGVGGDDVRQAQRRLSERGWVIRVDSVFGPKTEGIVRAFQREKGLDADGVIGPQTWDALWVAPITSR